MYVQGNVMYVSAFFVSEVVRVMQILAVYFGALLALLIVAYCAYKFYHADESKILARLHFSALRFDPDISRDIALASPRAYFAFAGTSSDAIGLTLATSYHAAAEEKIRRGAYKWRAECEAFWWELGMGSLRCFYWSCLLDWRNLLV